MVKSEDPYRSRTYKGLKYKFEKRYGLSFLKSEGAKVGWSWSEKDMLLGLYFEKIAETLKKKI